MLMANAGYVWMFAGSLCAVKHFDWVGSGNDYASIRETDPFIAILLKERVVLSPVIRLVFARVRVDTLGDLGWETIHEATRLFC